jgi:hypothetical protein
MSDKYYNQQLAGQAPMMTQPGGNRNAKNLPVGPEGREWSNGLCSCFDLPGTCKPLPTLSLVDASCPSLLCIITNVHVGFMATCCPCIVHGRNKNRLEYLEANGQPDPDHGGTFNGSCCADCILLGCGLNWILSVSRLRGVRLHEKKLMLFFYFLAFCVDHSASQEATPENATALKVTCAETAVRLRGVLLVIWSRNIKKSSSRKGLTLIIVIRAFWM